MWSYFSEEMFDTEQAVEEIHYFWDFYSIWRKPEVPTERIYSIREGT